MHFNIVSAIVVGPFAYEDPQTKVDIVNRFKQRASMSIDREYKGEENSQKTKT